MLNDPTILEASRVFAEKLISSDQENAVEIAFRSIICREISSEEMAIVEGYLADERALFTEDPGKADKIIEVGEYPIQEGLDRIEVAALMQTILLMYNMEEATTRG